MRYTLRILLIYCGVLPFIISIMAIFLMMTNLSMTFLITTTMLMSGVAAGIMAAKGSSLPNHFNKRYAPIAIPLGYTVILWAVCMLGSSGFYGSTVWDTYIFLQIPFFPISFVASLYGMGFLYFLAPLSYHFAFVIAFFLQERRRIPRIIIDKKLMISATAIILLAMGIGSLVHYQRSLTVLPPYGFEHGGGYSSTDLWSYDVTNPNNRLPRLAEQATFTIEDPRDMLVMDGAEAAFPVYSAFAQATYNPKGAEFADGRYVTFTNTIYAYERLINREVDIYFGAEPSDEQLKLAEDSGRELVMTPIGKEAFVFFVNQDNAINSLQVSEIKYIYSGKIRNWKEVGGADGKIIAFQRPKNSGSQTLLEKIMADTPLIKPLKEEVPRGMGGILEQVADYRNDSNSIGFSFRFFATSMNKNSDIKLLAINDIEPDTANISSGIYPFTANLYAITLKDNPKPKVIPFLEWMQGPQGQRLVEEVGYVNQLQTN